MINFNLNLFLFYCSSDAICLLDCRTLVDEGLIECTDPFNIEVCIVDLNITILCSILTSGEIPDEVEQNQTSHVNPHLQAVKQFLGEGGYSKFIVCEGD